MLPARRAHSVTSITCRIRFSCSLTAVSSFTVLHRFTMDIETLICAVQHHPLLWDTASADYKDKRKKHQAWVEVAKILFEDYDNQSQDQQELIVRDVVSKWRTVRDNYVRNLKQRSIKPGSGAKKVRTYIYSKQLSFLKKSSEPTPTFRTMDTQPDSPKNECDGDNRETEEDYHTPTANETVVLPQQLPSSRKRKLTDVERSFITFMESHSMKKATPQDDEDLAFFYSILPTVKTLTPNEKFTFRIESMKLLQYLKQARSFPPTLPPYQGYTSRPPSNTSDASLFSNFSPGTEASSD
ncbi:uncharacterized protein LOC111864605 [Cryptotermes secundus]|uniref:uncharacterized protein LOC111864605 n=1 Tax=Cryptotermes secundus TaxID=105785 RepID=UPI000CD7B0A8|nr:uncharacterized protein LOC111864605 [Cryptotermes secundus]